MPSETPLGSGRFPASPGVAAFRRYPRTERTHAHNPEGVSDRSTHALVRAAVASSSVMHMPSGTPLGSGAFSRVTGGSGEAPQPPAILGNRFAIEHGRRRDA